MSPRHRRWERALCVVTPVVALAGLAVSAGTHGQALFSPGPLSPGHRGIENDCAACHTVPFRTVRFARSDHADGVVSAACLVCHDHQIDHDPGTYAATHARPAGAAIPCAKCHFDHEGVASRTVDNPTCAACHAKIASQPGITVANVSRFSEGHASSHPQFDAVANGRDPTGLTFSHRRHLYGVQDLDGNAVRLDCVDCHRSVENKTGAAAGSHLVARYMTTVRFDDHCAGCHPLDSVALGSVPHLDPAEIRRMSGDAVGGIAALESELYGDGGLCVRCHTINASGPAKSPSIATTNIATRWFERARFDHARHDAVGGGAQGRGPNAPCTFCHVGALTSTTARDVLVPGIERCRTCHGESPTSDDNTISTRCVDCHTYHVAAEPEPRGYGAEPALIAKGKFETERGLQTSTPYWPIRAFHELPAKIWNLPDVKPGSPEFDREVFVRYGLFRAPEENDGLPFGLIKTTRQWRGEDGIAIACEFCHSSSLFGEIVRGLPNRHSDMQRLFLDMSAICETRGVEPLFDKTPAQNNTIVNAADQLALLGLIYRNPDLTMDAVMVIRILNDSAMEYKPVFDELAHLKTPAWWNYGTKKSGAMGYYWDGGAPKTSNFSAFTYALAYRDVDPAPLIDALDAWIESGPAYLATLKAPKYPFPIDLDQARSGRVLYDRLCARCHGTYASEVATASTLRFPGIVVPNVELGADPLRAAFSTSIVAEIKSHLREDFTLTGGYAAPPLTGIWARAPYLHNGSVPNMRQLLRPHERVPAYVHLADPNDPKDFDQVNLGWRFAPFSSGTKVDEFARVYDPTRMRGLTNTGHSYATELDDSQVMLLIEFLKTL